MVELKVKNKGERRHSSERKIVTQCKMRGKEGKILQKKKKMRKKKRKKKTKKKLKKMRRKLTSTSSFITKTINKHNKKSDSFKVDKDKNND